MTDIIIVKLTCFGIASAALGGMAAIWIQRKLKKPEPPKEIDFTKLRLRASGTMVGVRATEVSDGD